MPTRQSRLWVSWNMTALAFCFGGLVMTGVLVYTPLGRRLVFREEGPSDRAAVKLPGTPGLVEKKALPPSLAHRGDQPEPDPQAKASAKAAVPDPMAELQRVNEINERNRQRMGMGQVPGQPRRGFDPRNPGVPAGQPSLPPGPRIPSPGTP